MQRSCHQQKTRLPLDSPDRCVMIRGVRTTTMSQNNGAIERTLEKQRTFLKVVESRIQEAIIKKESLPATTLAKDLGPAFNMEWPRAYQMIGLYLDERPELFIKKGPKGGITLREAEKMEQKDNGKVVVKVGDVVVGSQG